MIAPLLFGFVSIVVSVIVQAYGTVLWLKYIVRSFHSQTTRKKRGFILKLLSISFIFFSILHAVQTLLWALLYHSLPEIHTDFSNFSEAWYFSMVTFTSLGYGDITLSGDWRLLSGIQAVNGIMLIGWSTAMMYSLIQRIFKWLTTN